MANGISAFGTLLKRNGTTIAEVTDITPPGFSRDTFELTHHQSPNMWREFGKSLKDGGEVSFSINYIPTNSTHNAATGLLGDFANNSTTDTWAIVFPDTGGTTWSFPGIVTDFSPSAPIDDKLAADVTLKISGQPTLA